MRPLSVGVSSVGGLGACRGRAAPGTVPRGGRDAVGYATATYFSLGLKQETHLVKSRLVVVKPQTLHT